MQHEIYAARGYDEDDDIRVGHFWGWVNII